MSRARPGVDGALPEPTSTGAAGEFETAAIPSGLAAEGERPAFETASHEVLFETAEASRCDACGEPLDDGTDDDGYGLRGNGVYVWTRGDCVHFEKAPLCASCASAIGMTALGRWEIEEEEG
jgi:hypothetical protein